MKKLTKDIFGSLDINYIFWDLDGTLIDSEIVWYNMDNIISEKYNVSGDDIYKYQEEEAANMYNNIGYRANAEKFLNSNYNIINQIIINSCPLTNDAMYTNKAITKGFDFSKFTKIISDNDFLDRTNVSKSEMYDKAIELCNISEEELNRVIVFEDLPADLKAAKEANLITVWAKNPDYPFTEEELEEINRYSDYYIEDFSDLV